ncbi:MAG: Flp pilus assembly complex ATPase component TadA [Lachnospiraceae bacterium]|nr:Flp pilus assembly complex ATPase component TadA [Lachnospiraceae bacterium]MBQ3163335.1 Flp pilus assembly complex ATPase component TadA [Lachnospiraceae bacterium]MBQ6993728.1 Flp pilus assembly complex ATPase component TadA [Lachnospiraceae bacterium]
MDFNKRKIRLGELLVETGAITQEQLEHALQKQKKTNLKLGETLVDEGIITEDDIAKALSQQLNLEIVDLQNINIDKVVVGLVPVNLLKKYTMIPFAFNENNKNILRVAMENPLDTYAQEDISIITNYQVEPVVATTRSIMLAIDKYYGQDDVKSALKQYAKEKKLEIEEDVQEDEDVNSSPIVKLVKEMIDLAVRQRASDIHIEPMEEYIRVRYRIDGVLQKKAKYNISVLPAIIARIKIIGGMDISEKRKPQDGRITQVVDHVEYDIRVSILPTVFGEKVVMRLTAKMALTREKSQLGLKPYELKQFDYILSNPHGILLVTGPTGSGKSTTLYTALSELNTSDVNIITVEDPVEANIDGINQVQVNPKAELTFASALRSILRQDPDIIMIGEIRDQETAAIAVQASITGHLVVSTLHTNSAASSITRLEDMGIESYLIADSVIGVIAQRLVRRLCPVCKEAREATVEEKEFMGQDVDKKITLYEPCGCAKCDNTGYKGRIGVYEIMTMTPALKTMISKREGAERIKEQAMEEGMRTLRMSGSEYVLDGTTSFAELVKISFDV